MFLTLSCYGQDDCDLFYTSQIWKYFQEKNYSSLADQLSKLLFNPNKPDETSLECYANTTTLINCPSKMTICQQFGELSGGCAPLRNQSYISIRLQKNLFPRETSRPRRLDNGNGFTTQYFCNFNRCNSLVTDGVINELILDNYESLAIYVPENFTGVTSTTQSSEISTSNTSNLPSPPRSSASLNALRLKLTLLSFLSIFLV